ncbi:GIY-YIG nuclease family protein [Rhizobium aethiopicum]|uniref:GIY-YIG nuclease family protein n=1 Tax=Rhizobium aethiopicum TaxID=1138170 RepID=UPI00161062E1
MAYFVYAVGGKDDAGPLSGMLKIGRARDPHNRLVELQIGCPFQVELKRIWRFSTQSHGCEFELACHKRFRNQKVSGEWFRIDLENVHQFIVELAEVRMLQISHADGNNSAPCPTPPAPPKFSLANAAKAFMEARRQAAM